MTVNHGLLMLVKRTFPPIKIILTKFKTDFSYLRTAVSLKGKWCIYVVWCRGGICAGMWLL